MRIYDWFGSFGSFPISRYQCPSITIEGNKPVGFRLRSDHERTPSRVQIFCSINFNRIINDLNANCAEVNMTAVENWWLSRTAMRISFSRERERERERETRVFFHRILFFALTWRTCSVRYMHRVIHWNPSTTAIQPPHCNVVAAAAMKQPVINHAKS